jgi:CoA:oxalate CoA-transferase
MAGVPINFEKTPGGIQRPAPMLGQHTEEVLQELGFGEARVARLRAEGIIGKLPET